MIRVLSNPTDSFISQDIYSRKSNKTLNLNDIKLLPLNDTMVLQGAGLSDRWVLSIGMSKVNLGKGKSVLLILGVIRKSETIEHGHTSLLHIFECAL